jgi:light-regulated signal transduction histidine kinase (bacteriophytochrome)
VIARSLSAQEDTAAEFREFAYIVSHDLQGPTRAMVELSRLLKSDRAEGMSDDEEVYLSLIIDSGEKLQGMIAGLLAFSRINGQKVVLQKLNMQHLCASFARATTLRYPKYDLDFTAGHLPIVHADRQCLEQVLGALFDNSVKFARPDQNLSIRIDAAKKAGFHVFHFADNGIGVGPEFLEVIFKPLRKLHADGDYPGIGMGLTLARKLITRHGGEMWAEEGESGQGVCVCFTLPVLEK